ncbi:XdhC family protein [Mariniluteicoccus flavus]
MRDIAAELRLLVDGAEPFALAVIAKTWRSSPRPAGTFMAVTADGRAIGSLSGGCIEGAVYDAALEVIASGEPVAAHYGVTGEDALRLGLTCGGEIDVTIARVDPGDEAAVGPLRAVMDALADERPVALVERVRTDPERREGTDAGLGRWLAVTEDGVRGSLGMDGADRVAVEAAREVLHEGRTTLVELPGLPGAAPDEALVVGWAPPARLIVFGAIDFARAVSRLGVLLGHHVTVCDARPVFATRERFPEAHELVVDWPHRWLAGEVEAGRVTASTVILVLTHDPKFDVPALEVALRSAAGFVGALGSRRTTREREKELRQVGLTDEELARLSAPVGLDINAHTPEETAVSIMAEVIAARGGGTGRRLSAGEMAIHRD